MNINKWKLYLKHLGEEFNPQNIESIKSWSKEGNTLFFDMLHEISSSLGYHFNRDEIEKEIYSPKGQVSIETEQQIIKGGFAKLFSGNLALPMEVKSFPADAETAQTYKEVQKELLKWLKSGAVVIVAHKDDHHIAQ